MDNFTVCCLLALLANVLAPVECQSPTTTTTEAPCRKDGSEGQLCYRTALCETCSQTEVRCYEKTDLSTFKSRHFDDAFCGHHGVVLIQGRSGHLENLLPLECSNGICPDQSECRKSPKDGMSYCCSLDKLDGSEKGGRDCGPTEDSELDDWTGNRETYPDDERDDVEETSDDINDDDLSDNTDDIPVAIDTRKNDSISTDVHKEAVDTNLKNELRGQYSSFPSTTDISTTKSVDEIDGKDLEKDLNGQFSSSISPDHDDTDSNVEEDSSSSSSVTFSTPVSQTDSIGTHSGDESVHENVPEEETIEPFSSTTQLIEIDTFLPESTIPDEVLVD